MSVESEILRIQHNVANAYAAISEKGGQVPLQPNSANLAAAVASIPAGTGDTTYLVRAPVGTIVIWSGTADNIPTGWQLCDGTNGTPDLRDKFVLGAGTNHAVGDSGGSEEVTLTVAQMPSHLHREKIPGSSGNSTTYMRLKNGTESSGVVSITTISTGGTIITTDNTGSSQPHPNMPPYYTLCYIMKLTADETDGVTMDQVNSAIDAKLNAYEPQEVYSTEETRIGTWIDGKPLYRMIISGTMDISTGRRTLRDCTSLNIKTVVNLRGIVDYSNDFLPIPYTDLYSSTNWGLTFLLNKSKKLEGVFRTAASPGILYNYIAVLEYTKTSDTATIKERAAFSFDAETQDSPVTAPDAILTD